MNEKKAKLARRCVMAGVPVAGRKECAKTVRRMLTEGSHKQRGRSRKYLERLLMNQRVR